MMMLISTRRELPHGGDLSEHGVYYVLRSVSFDIPGMF